MPKGRINVGDLNVDATASIGKITASFIDADTIEVGNIIRKEIDPCCVYVTGSSDVASIRYRSIQPKNSSHVNTGDYSVINGGSLNCIDGPTTTIFNGIHAGSCNVIQNSSGSVIAGGMDNDVFSSLGVIGGGRCNQITGASPFSAILGGFDNCVKGHSDAFIIGSNIISSASCTTFVNCLNIQDIDQAVPGDHLLTRHTESGLVRQGPSISQVEGDVFFTDNLLNPNVDVYRTGSSGVASVSSASIQPYFTTHNNSGHFSVIGGGDNHCIIDSFNTGTPFHDGIFSGKDNCILDVSSTFIGGGFKNLVSSPSSGSVIGGGVCNQIEGDFTSGNESIIVGGRGNCLKNTSRAFIGGGQDNTISSSLESSIVGGDSNTLRTAGYSSIAGGQGNCITDVANAGFIGGGIENQITSNTSSSFDTIVNGNCNEITLDLNKGAVGSNTIIGGNDNTIKISALTGSLIPDGFNQIGGGKDNTITGSVEHSTIIGGKNNTILHDCLKTCRNQVFITSGSSIVGGINNQIYNSPEAFIGGGTNNKIGGTDNANYDHCRAAIVAGCSNKIKGPNSEMSIIGAGSDNEIIGGVNNLIGAGKSNSIYHGIANGIVSGRNNYITSYKDCNFIGAGANNQINGSDFSSIVGGVAGCMVSSQYSIIAGGYGNCIRPASNNMGATPWFNFIGGGYMNRVSGHKAGIVAGYFNRLINSKLSIIGAGTCNKVCYADNSSVVGGKCNHISGSFPTRVCWSSILGGQCNIVNDGHNNTFIIGSNLTSSRACTTFMNSTDISGSVDLNPDQIPTSDVGLRVGQLYRTGSAFDEIRIKL